MRYIDAVLEGKYRRDTLYDFSLFLTADQPVLHLVRIFSVSFSKEIFIRLINVVMDCPGRLSISPFSKL